MIENPFVDNTIYKIATLSLAAVGYQCNKAGLLTSAARLETGLFSSPPSIFNLFPAVHRYMYPIYL